MKRRDFVTGLGAGVVGTALAGCAKSAPQGGAVTSSAKGKKYRWKMVTTWPKDFPGLGTGASFLAETINKITGGRIDITVYGAGELVPAFEVFDAVAGGTAQMGHGGSYYWKGKAEATQLFGAVPFGMNANEMSAWLYYGGGMALWTELYDRFGLIPAMAGHTGVQMGGWFNREIVTAADLRGLKIRIPGLGGEVMRRAGAVPITRPGGELFTALQTGDIDAAEWVGPYNDLAFGLHKVTRYYYYPGWHEPDAVLEATFNKDAYNALPEDLQAAVMTACAAAAAHMLAEYTARNHAALETLRREHDIVPRPFPREVLDRLRGITQEVLTEIARRDPEFGRILASYQGFQKDVREWHRISDQAYYEIRG